MMKFIFLLTLYLFAAIGIVSICHIIIECNKERKIKKEVKLKEKFKQDVVEVINELMEEEDEL